VTTHTPPNAASAVRTKIQSHLAEYGTVAVVVYFTIFFAVLLSLWAAIHLGWRPESATGSAGAFAAAYVATKLTQPLRIAGTLALTPLVAHVYRRFTAPPPA
jgi:uncharacterized membrane protein